MNLKGKQRCRSHEDIFLRFELFSFKGGSAGFDMKILFHVIFLLMLEGIYCQNNRNAKASSKVPKKPSSPSAEVGPDDDTRAGSQQSASANKPADDMKLNLLRNTPATCNDGTAAG